MTDCLAGKLLVSTGMFLTASVFATAAATSRLMMHVGRLVMGNSSEATGEHMVGQVVEHRGDRRWRGLVVGNTTSTTPGNPPLLLVHWSRPEKFIGLADIGDLVAIHDRTVKDRYVRNR